MTCQCLVQQCVLSFSDKLPFFDLLPLGPSLCVCVCVCVWIFMYFCDCAVILLLLLPSCPSVYVCVCVYSSTFVTVLSFCCFCCHLIPLCVCVFMCECVSLFKYSWWLCYHFVTLVTILSRFTLPISDLLYLVPHLKDVPLAEFMYFVFTCMPGVVTIGNSDLCCRVPCLSNALISLCWFLSHSEYHLMTRVTILSHSGSY